MRSKLTLVSLSLFAVLLATAWPAALLQGRDAATESATTTATAMPKSKPTAYSPASGRLVVHEWGTFTNIAGSDGVLLDYRPLVTSDLPDFVLDRPWQNAVANPFSKSLIWGRQRMETPVLYFYSDRIREMDVRVDFPAGLLTEFYPPVMAMGPEYVQGERRAELRDSFLHWKIRIVPDTHLPELAWTDDAGQHVPAPPEVAGDDHYGYARETDAALVEATTPFDMKWYERLLFYRGVGDFQLPIRFEALGRGRFEVGNLAADDIHSLFLVRIEEGRVYFSRHERLPGKAVAYLEESRREGSVEDLAEQMVAALTATGLYEKEARAMVKTWRSSWFGEEGTRLLYLVPPRITDEVLPLRLDPQPDELVRVLVGRMEVMTPEKSEELAAAIRQLGTCATVMAEPLRGRLTSLGRFAEPALEFLARTSAEGDYRTQVRSLVAELRDGGL